jgi:glycolate oxidase FAD binding subunit
MLAEADTVFKSEDALAAAITDAAQTKTPVNLIGAGTKAGLGRPFVHAATTLSTAKLSGVTLYEPAELVLSAQSGTTVAEIEKLLDSNNQMLAFEPPDYARLLGTEPGKQTIGGVVATNLSGPRRIYAGAARDLLIGTRAVNGLGEVIRGGGRVMKNVTGLDLPRAMAGSYGTLSALTECTFKVLPKGEVTRTLAVTGLDLDRASTVMSAAVTSPYEISASAWLTVSQVTGLGIDGLPGDGTHGVVFLRLENFANFVTRRMQALIARLREDFADTDFVEIDTAASKKLWRSIADVAPFAGTGFADHVIWRLSVPPVLGGSVAQALKLKLPDSASFIDWGGGLIWFALPPLPPGEMVSKATTIRQVVAGVTGRRGGRATLVRASDEVRNLVPVFDPPVPVLDAINKRLKHSFDPHGLFSPGRMHATL